MMGGKGPMALAVMWSFVAISWIFVALRLYTRIWITQSVGADDHAYWMSGVLILLYTIFTHIAATHGFGQSMPGPDATDFELDEAALAIKNEVIGQTFSVIGMAVAKFSLGLFLLRIIIERWQKILIWIVMASLSVVSLLAAISLWVQCSPVSKIFDMVRVPGECNIDVTPFAVTLGVWCAVADFFFAIFPWLFIWKLNMKYKEKITIAGSMSFGVIAGVCGIVRTYEVASGFTANYTLDTVPLIIWSAAEMAVTLICIGIPILRPLWRQAIRGSKLSSDRYYRKQGEGSDGQAYSMGNLGQSKSRGATDSHRGFPDADPKLGIRGPSTVTQIAGYNKSDESILGSEYRNDATTGPVDGTIRVKQDVQIDWTRGSAV
ncbi:hypothetical protein NW762_009331 [Fusarium torreyae]|uniref:Rhodopsin domain-containing protein n=1 Tax=Fusarium torreyae TaxID=1237075 RepID=A0A9W8VCS2_9HYPO|nr:hypothetical protein NW762_009331 [Fusarium torreyae]